MLEWMFLPFRRYFDFSGRSRRMEYWSFHLLGWSVTVISVVLILAGGTRTGTSDIDTAGGAYQASAAAAVTYGPLAYLGGTLLVVWSLAAIIPSLALSVRRLHDRDKSGLWLLLTLIPFLGLIFALIILVDMFLSGTPGPNRFGEDPKGAGTNSDVFA